MEPLLFTYNVFTRTNRARYFDFMDMSRIESADQLMKRLDQGEASKLIKLHFMYIELGKTANVRHASYRELFRYHLEPSIIEDIRKTTNGKHPWGYST